MPEHRIPVTVNGRYIVDCPEGDGPYPIVMGFHGYGQSAEDMNDMLKEIPGIENWLCCGVEALHPFYNAERVSGASWMTDKDRELRIQENTDYINAVYSDLSKKYSINSQIVYLGYSQGAAMACRAAVLGKADSTGIILMGGDIPPDVAPLERMKNVLLIRGEQDPIYREQAWLNDIARLQSGGVAHTAFEYGGNHTPEKKSFELIGAFLNDFAGNLS